MQQPDFALPNPPRLLIGAEGGEHVALALRPARFRFGRGPHEDWADALVDVQAGGFRGAYSGTFQPDDFRRLLEQLETLHATLRGTATFDCLEGWLEVELAGERLGGIAVRGRAYDGQGPGCNELSFRFRIDQSQLPGMLQSLRQCMAAFRAWGWPRV